MLNLVDHVLPDVPVRQVVLTVPFPLPLAFDWALLRQVVVETCHSEEARKAVAGCPEGHLMILPRIREICSLERRRSGRSLVAIDVEMGRAVGAQIQPLIDKMRLLLDEANLEHWSKEAQQSAQQVLAYALAAFGEQTGQNGPMEEASSMYRRILEEHTCEDTPAEWAALQNSLGSVSSVLGQSGGDPKRLEEALIAYREALKASSRDRDPCGWSMIEVNLGNALASPP